MNEEWRPISGFDRYEVSSLGRVRRVFPNGDWKIMRINTATRYPGIGLYRSDRQETFSVHKLVASAFLGPKPNGQEIRHIDGNRLNNSAANLVYGTRDENIADTIKHGANAKERNGRSKITALCASGIRHLTTKEGVSLSACARAFGISVKQVQNIRDGRAWS